VQEPLRGQTYTQRMGQAQPLMLRAEAGADAKTLFWLADDAFIGKSRPGEGVAWTPNIARRYTLRVVDDQGRADSREVPVEWVP
jgi:penicillin-binding protein 1C